MAADGPLAAFFGAVEVAWKVYDLGWAQNQYSRPEFADFGSEIQSLAQNLSNTVRVVENARLQYQQHAIRSPRFCGFSSQKNWDLSSLHEIIGPFRDTLSQCEMMVARTLRGDLTNHETIQTAEEIAIIHFRLDELQKSVRAHNHKISILLKPLEIKLFSDIQLEFGVQVPPNRHVQVIPYVPMQALLVAGIEQALVEYWQPRPVPLIVPDELESKLQSSIEHQYKPELRMSSGMFLHTALENFLTCFEQSTRSFTGSSFLKDRTPSAKQYINLLRCFLILKQLQESDELKWVDQSSLWPAFVVELWDQVRMECHRFDASSQQQLIVPNLASLRSELERGVQTRSKKEEILNLMSPLQDTDMEEVFRVPLPSPQESLKRHLTVSRMEPTKLRLVESVANESDPANPLGEISMDIDLRTIQLIPLYAIPSSRPRLFEVLLHTGSSQLNPSFMEHKQVLRLQHLLTGYKVHQRYDQAMVRISFFITGRSEPLEEQGRIQLWLPQPFTPVNKVLSSKASISARSERPDTQVVIPSKPLAQTETSRSRAGSIRQLISGLRLGSDRTKALSNGHNKRSNSTTGSSNYSSSPVASPATSSQGPTLGHNNSKTVHEIGGEFAGPFELPSENSAAFYQNTSFRGLNANTAWVPPATNLNTLPISSHYVAPSRNYTAGWTRSNGPAPSPNDVQPVSPTNYLSVDSHNSPPGLHGQAYAAAGSGNIYPGLYGQPYAPTRSDSSSPGLHPGLQPHTTTRSDTSSPYYQPSSNIHADTSSPTNLTTQSNTSPPLHPNFAIPHLTTNAAPPIARKALPHRLPPVQSVFTYQRPSVPTNQYATSASPPHLPPFQPQPATHSDHVPATPSRPTRASPSVVSNMSVCSCSSLAPTVSTIRTSTSNSSSTSSGIARLHRKPQKPLLVMFLKGRDASARLSIVAVEIDHNTAVKRERCECYNSHSSCRVSCVEQERGGILRAQRWDAEDLAAWDVAKVGEWQRKEGEKVWPNLRRVSMKFEKMEDRYKFAGSPCSCNVRTTHELSHCNLESHNGLFGIVKQVGDEMLRKYHSERDQASSRTIQLGPVPEAE
ncbi:hypothetical protein EG327_010838 [Venturia inaequalis]|uniref:Uncharacterized protein n=1 Tax=Venturia inaequalis TaxID=5025 RepID=A0A8H3VX12_VENIN|nr:hypothetical protein EG327_010838 [Venturia inaequalis]